MSNPFNLLSSIFTVTLAYVAYNIRMRKPAAPKQTNLVFYVHDYLTGHDASAATVAGKKGPDSSILHFGTVLTIDDPVTVGPTIESQEIGRAQGSYINSELAGKAVHMMFSVTFTHGEYKGSTLEIQGTSKYLMKEREFGVVSGTGFFRFVKGYGIMSTDSVDLVNLRSVFKLNVTVKHY